jgi:hypothetical protein
MFGMNIIRLEKAVTFVFLVWRKLPALIEHSLFWTQSRARITMAIQTPAHCERRDLARQLHLLDCAVTCGASDALCDMHRVIEIDIGRQVMNAIPTDRTILGQARADRREHFRIRPDLRMTGHARLRRRQTGEPRLLDGGVTISTIEAQAADMMFMAERHRLIA